MEKLTLEDELVILFLTLQFLNNGAARQDWGEREYREAIRNNTPSQMQNDLRYWVNQLANWQIIHDK